MIDDADGPADAHPTINSQSSPTGQVKPRRIRVEFMV